MKFSHSIQFNSVPEWSEHYIAYSNLKKLIYVLEKEIVEARRLQRISNIPEAQQEEGRFGSTNTQFESALLKELDRIDSFYHKMEANLLLEAEQFFNDYDNAVEVDTKVEQQFATHRQENGPKVPALQSKASTSSLSSVASGFLFHPTNSHPQEVTWKDVFSSPRVDTTIH
jgi:SPX domain protein involved in polyphosphate accumulation